MGLATTRLGTTAAGMAIAGGEVAVLEGTSAVTIGPMFHPANDLTGGVSTLRQMYQLAIVR
jgi:hypothetical protein